jgi:hypothetical protein
MAWDWLNPASIILLGIVSVIVIVGVLIAGSELPLATPLDRWRNVAIAASLAVVGGGIDRGFSAWDLIPAAVVFVTVVFVSAERLKESRRRRRRRAWEPPSRPPPPP